MKQQEITLNQFDSYVFGLITTNAKRFSSEIMLTYDGYHVKVKNSPAALGLGLTKGSVVTISAQGEDEEQAIKYFVEMLKRQKVID